jgi:hypothetical protein
MCKSEKKVMTVSIVTIGLKICDAQEKPAPCGEYDTSQQGKVLNVRLMIKCHRNTSQSINDPKLIEYTVFQ